MRNGDFQRRKASIFVLFGLTLMSTMVGASAAQVGPTGDLRVDVNQVGLSALSYRGRSLLNAAGDGAFRIAEGSPLLRALNGKAGAGSTAPTVERFDAGEKTVTRTYAWGIVRARYVPQKDRLVVRLSVTNASRTSTIERLKLRLAELAFPASPQAEVLDAGQFGLDRARPLSDGAIEAPTRAMPPIVGLRDGGGTLLFCGDDPADPVTLGASGAGSHASLEVSFGAIAPGRSATAEVSLRFGSPDAGVRTLAGDVLDRYAKRYPFQVAWRDRRPIGGLVLASIGKHAAGNPRGWFNNVTEVDVTTPAGLEAFRTRLLAYADESIRQLRAANAQGMITWDVEGEEIDDVCYYGDPRLAERVAPETAFRGCLDAYFKKFRDAGFRVGVCLRPQQIRFVNGVPKQEDPPDPESVLRAKIAYARRRWGCTLFYLDSTVDAERRALPADLFQHLAEANRDVLLVPENETLRDYAYAAPLNSFQHHGVTSTPPGARLVYPRAFSVLFAMEGDYAHHFDALVASVRRGDILLFRGWWADPNNAEIRRIYEAAAKR